MTSELTSMIRAFGCDRQFVQLLNRLAMQTKPKC